MYCPHCGNMKQIKFNLVKTFNRSKHGTQNEIHATCLRCKEDFGCRYQIKVANGQVMLS